MLAATNVSSHGRAAGERLAGERPAPPCVKEQFHGTWRLLSWKIEQANGELIDSPLGPDPLGWIMYQPGQHMSVALMRPDRPKFASDNLVEATPEAYRERGRFMPPNPPERANQMEKAWAYPVIADGKLYIRDTDCMWCFDIKDVATGK